MEQRFRYYFRIMHTAYAKFRLRRLRYLFSARPEHAFSPKWHKLWNLYWRIKKEKPNIVVEFGSGCSTIIIAQALYENGRGGALFV